MWPGGGGESGARSCRAEGEDGTSRPEGASLGPSSQDPTHGVRHCGCRPEWPRVCRAGRPGHVPATPCCLCARRSSPFTSCARVPSRLAPQALSSPPRDHPKVPIRKGKRGWVRRKVSVWPTALLLTPSVLPQSAPPPAAQGLVHHWAPHWRPQPAGLRPVL